MKALIEAEKKKKSEEKNRRKQEKASIEAEKKKVEEEKKKIEKEKKKVEEEKKKVEEEKKKVEEERKRREEEERRRQLEEERKRMEEHMRQHRGWWYSKPGERYQNQFSKNQKITVYCTWHELVPFQFKPTCQLSTVFDIMFKRLIPNRNKNKYYLVDNQDPYEVLPLGASLEEMGLLEGTVFASNSCSHSYLILVRHESRMGFDDDDDDYDDDYDYDYDYDYDDDDDDDDDDDGDDDDDDYGNYGDDDDGNYYHANSIIEIVNCYYNKYHNEEYGNY